MSRLRVPTYRRFKPKNLGLVVIDGRQHYLGPYGSPGSVAEYDRLIQEYLAGKSESLINTVRPVLMQSAADKLHGVRVVVHPHDHQAHLDDSIPFGTVIEDID